MFKNIETDKSRKEIKHILMRDNENMDRRRNPRRRGGFQLIQNEGDQLLYIGSYACSRHRADELARMQAGEQLAYLCPDEVDFVTGSYLEKIEDAVRELAKERSATSITLMPGCQCALMSTDFDALTKQLTEELEIPVRSHDKCRLCEPEMEYKKWGAREGRNSREGRGTREGRDSHEGRGSHEHHRHRKSGHRREVTV